jgi:ABC-type lipoprotein export system ATPase subunit
VPRDQPTEASTRSAGEILDILGQLNEIQKTIIMVTHDPHAAAATT